MTRVVAFDAACARLLQARAGRRIVLGTGCFDMLHAGHLFFLEEAARQGDLLVVGVNSDESVRELKGPTRPIVGEAERARLIAALRCVDLVFVYGEKTAVVQIRALRPDVFAIGAESADCYPTELAAAQEVGARAHLIGRLPRYSTTSLIDTVRTR